MKCLLTMEILPTATQSREVSLFLKRWYPPLGSFSNHGLSRSDGQELSLAPFGLSRYRDLAGVGLEKNARNVHPAHAIKGHGVALLHTSSQLN
jgi:hypothetical protein